MTQWDLINKIGEREKYAYSLAYGSRNTYWTFGFREL